jgi:hypothetical protein
VPADKDWVSRYATDPLLRARETHRPAYKGSPDGRCCVACEEEAPGKHITFPCAVVAKGQCEFTFGDEWRCIQAAHEGDRHLVEARWGGRMVVSPVD